MKNAEYWIWLQSSLGYASSKPIKILERFESIDDFYNLGEAGWRKLRMFTPHEIKALCIITIEDAKRVIEDCFNKGYKILTPEDDEYPIRLKRINNPPSVLYIWGNLPQIDDAVAISMVGTRKSSVEGNRMAETLGYRLAQAGAVIVSGGAVGIDSHSHIGALAAGGKNVLVMGCGLSCRYLMHMNILREAVAANGAVISEYQPYTEPSQYTFPQRNRIMAALSLGTVVVEAPIKSGSLITVTNATEQGKDVFAVPASVLSKRFAGNCKMLQDGAKPVYAPIDILNEYFLEYSHLINTENLEISIGDDVTYLNGVPTRHLSEQLINRFSDETKIYSDLSKQPVLKVAEPISEYKTKAEKPILKGSLPIGMSESAVKVYNCFTNKIMPLDILINKSGINSPQILTILTQLEIAGVIKPLPGSRYMIIK